MKNFVLKLVTGIWTFLWNALFIFILITSVMNLMNISVDDNLAQIICCAILFSLYVTITDIQIHNLNDNICHLENKLNNLDAKCNKINDGIDYLIEADIQDNEKKMLDKIKNV